MHPVAWLYSLKPFNPLSQKEILPSHGRKLEWRLSRIESTVPFLRLPVKGHESWMIMGGPHSFLLVLMTSFFPAGKKQKLTKYTIVSKWDFIQCWYLIQQEEGG